MKTHLKELFFLALTVAIMYCVIFLFALPYAAKDNNTVNDAVQNVMNGDLMVVLHPDVNAEEFITELNCNPNIFALEQDFTHIKPIGLLRHNIFMFREKYDNVHAKQQEIEDAATAALTILNVADKTEYETVLAVYDWVLENLEYGVLPNNEDQSICGGLIHKQARCAGYAKTFVYLLQKLDIPAEVIDGHGVLDGKSEPHAWAVAYIDGNPYYFDPTWDDQAQYGVSHDWFAVTYQEMINTHISDCEVKEAVHTTHNYYMHNNMYLSEVSDDTLLSAIAQQGMEFHLKCANQEIMDYIKEKLNDNDFRKILAERLQIDRIRGMSVIETQDVCCIHVQFT